MPMMGFSVAPMSKRLTKETKSLSNAEESLMHLMPCPNLAERRGNGLSGGLDHAIVGEHTSLRSLGYFAWLVAMASSGGDSSKHGRVTRFYFFESALSEGGAGLSLGVESP